MGPGDPPGHQFAAIMPAAGGCGYGTILNSDNSEKNDAARGGPRV